MTDLPPLRDVINRHGLFASKALGQNFLFDEQLLDRIAAIPGKLNGKAVSTVQGSKWTVRVRPSGIYLDNPWGYAMVTKTDINASNGVIHVIDQVLVPQAVIKQLEG